jgi:rRNA-processing protein FCF1
MCFVCVYVQVGELFGIMGTHIYMTARDHVSNASCSDGEGVQEMYCILWLQDTFYSDQLGRKVVVMAPSRTAASQSLFGFLYELTGRIMSLEEPLWMYKDPRDTKAAHGPFSSDKMAHWCEKKYFHDQMPVLYAWGGDDIWIPVWMVEKFAEFLREGAGFVALEESTTVDNMEWESTIQQDIHTLRQSNVSSVPVVEVRKDISRSRNMAPMDYDLIVPISDALDMPSKNVYIVAVLDTNVLLSHFSFLERVFGEIQEGGLHVKVSLLVVIPWVVLNELDHLKEGRQRQAAMYAIKRIHTLHSQRDSYVFIQGAGSHQYIVDTISLPDQQQSLRNDDFIMQTSLYFRDALVQKLRGKGHRAHAVLVSNDRGLQVRSEANGVTCIKAADLGRSGDALVKTLTSIESQGSNAPVQANRSSLNGLHEYEEEKDITQEVESFLNSLHIQPKSSPPKRTTFSTEQHITLHPTYTDEEPSDDEDVRNTLEYAIQHGLGSFVMYCRQQDLGDLWEDLLEDELKPPWEVSQVLKIIMRHSSTFWSVFDRRLLSEVKTLLYCIHPSRFTSHISQCVDIVNRLLLAAEAAFSKPINEMNEPPDPSSVPHFISLGDAKAAVAQGKKKLDTLF